MKLFLKNTSLFIILPIIYVVINLGINKYLINQQKLPIKNSPILIMGDSHTQTSLIPNVFNQAQNISQRAEPIILTYWKLKKIVKIYQPDILLLGWAPHNLSSFNDLKFSDSRWASEMFKRSYTIGDFKGLDTLIKVDYTSYYRTYLKKTGFYPNINHIQYIGKFSNSHTVYHNDINNALKRHFIINSKPATVSKTAITYLDSIIMLCKKHKITPVLVSNPVVAEYNNQIPKNIYENYNQKLKQYENDVIIINYTAKEYPETLFSNSDHLNLDGAERFTKEVIEVLSHSNRTKKLEQLDY
ncbi:hypothetical protein [Winogradskyella undariae]|uniref:hypothetical protein n=1 Tax=Winogradskyella undariae TaxID=1285465 RepID=UPI0015CA1C2B|nr:hypothetical protein [Winogradskyella undariae]